MKVEVTECINKKVRELVKVKDQSICGNALLRQSENITGVTIREQVVNWHCGYKNRPTFYESLFCLSLKITC